MRALRVKRFVQGILYFLVPSFLVQSEGRFFVPTRKTHTLSRAGAVKVGRRASLSAKHRWCQTTP